MDAKTYVWAIVVLALAGTLFSGYLTAYTFLSGHPGCEVYYFGMPSCFYGFIMYLLVFVLSVILFRLSRSAKSAALIAISLIGMAFSAYLTYTVMSNIACTTLDIFGQPPCVYGLAMYVLLLLIAISTTSPRK